MGKIIKLFVSKYANKNADGNLALDYNTQKIKTYEKPTIKKTS